MGYFGGVPFIKKYGKYFFMKEEDLDKNDTRGFAIKDIIEWN